MELVFCCQFLTYLLGPRSSIYAEIKTYITGEMSGVHYVSLVAIVRHPPFFAFSPSPPCILVFRSVFNRFEAFVRRRISSALFN